MVATGDREKPERRGAALTLRLDTALDRRTDLVRVGATDRLALLRPLSLAFWMLPDDRAREAEDATRDAERRERLGAVRAAGALDTRRADRAAERLDLVRLGDAAQDSAAHAKTTASTVPATHSRKQDRVLITHLLSPSNCLHARNLSYWHYLRMLNNTSKPDRMQMKSRTLQHFTR